MTELTGGLLVNDNAISLAIQLEARGHRLSNDHGVLKVSEGARLSAEDIAAIRRLRHHLIAIAVYPEMWNTWSAAQPDESRSSTVSPDAIRTMKDSSKATSSKSTTRQSTKSTMPHGKQKKDSNAFAWGETA